MSYIFVDDINTVTPTVCYIGKKGIVKRIDSYSDVVIIPTDTTISNTEYKKYAKNFF